MKENTKGAIYSDSSFLTGFQEEPDEDEEGIVVEDYSYTEEEEEEEEDRGKTRACVCVSGGKEKKALASKGTPPSTDAHRRHHPQH